MLIHFGVKPYIVFDGDYLPSKAHTEKERAAKRKESRRVGLELLRTDRLSLAQQELQKAVDVTPLMARELIEELKALGVPYIVAPYEADSQLAYLEKQGIISGILSEDSDLLVFGAQCLLTKLDQHGDCVMINRADFTACREISLVGWTDKDFRMMAMLSGCDYLPGINNMGLKTAYRLVRKHKTVERVVRIVQFDGKMKVPAGYLDAFARAEHTFLYQWVFCPETKCVLNLTKVPAGLELETMPYIGKFVDAAIATAVASGDLDPNTKERLVVDIRRWNTVGRTRSVQTPDEKRGKSIAEFFKPRRTPLAELDPNSFTPSPSQQHLLEAQGTISWSASQVPVSHISAATSRVPGANPPSSAPQATRRTVSEQLFGARGHIPPKRQRLCSDGMLADSMKGSVGIAGTSRFFQPNVSASPSLRKTSVQRKREDFNLWSDNTGATIRAPPEQAAKIDIPSPKKRKRLQVYADLPDADDESVQDPPSVENTQHLSASSTTSIDTSPTDFDTPTTSFDSTSQHSTFSKGINAKVAALRSSFVFKASTSPQGASRDSSTLSQAVRPTAEAIVELSGSTRAVRRLENQRSSLSDSEEGEAPDMAEENIVPCSSPPRAEITDVIEGIESPRRSRIEEQQASSPIPRLTAKGSEDFLIPASPISSRSEGEDNGGHRPKFDLGRFAFIG